MNSQLSTLFVATGQAEAPLPVVAETIQQQNLRKLAVYLRGYHRHFWQFRKPKFDMGKFCHEESYDSDNCGAVGCAVGHATYCVEPKLRREDWWEYCNRVLGVSRGSKSWYWLFHDGWETTDNTPLGAAKRIEYYLEKGLPKNYLSQLYGNEPLCY